jgi:hypothetical protein
MILVVATLAVQRQEIIGWYRFVSTFESIGTDTQGQRQYRHRKTGVQMVRTPDGDVFKLGGKVSRSQSFSRQAADHLWFCLDSVGKGWSIRISDRAESHRDFSMVVTLPLRWINHRDIVGWHFRNTDNSGFKETGWIDINAPGRRRDFCFVLNDADFQQASDALWTDEYGEIRTALTRGNGTLNITHLELGNLAPGQRAWIEEMEFEVELSVPDATES